MDSDTSKFQGSESDGPDRENTNGVTSSVAVRALYGAALTILLVLLIISASVAVPLYWRGFYYMHIKLLHLTELTPWTYDQIKEAFDQMMDFCMKGAPFGTGVLKWSEEGMQHFADCRVLFMLDKHILIGSAVAVAGLLLQEKLTGIKPLRIFNRGPFFWAGVIPAAAFAVIAALVSVVDFDQAFVTFHHMFFPGKSNWLFDYDLDQIIWVLPETFFMDCAILVVVIIMLLSAVSIVIDFKLRKNANE